MPNNELRAEELSTFQESAKSQIQFQLYCAHKPKLAIRRFYKNAQGEWLPKDGINLNVYNVDAFIAALVDAAQKLYKAL